MSYFDGDLVPGSRSECPSNPNREVSVSTWNLFKRRRGDGSAVGRAFFFLFRSQFGGAKYSVFPSRRRLRQAVAQIDAICPMIL